MKGIVFTEFIELVETKFGEQMVDDLLDNANLPSGGIYTAVGTYDHQEIVTLVSDLSQRTSVPVPDLLKTYGRFLFGRFTVLYPEFLQGHTSAFDFLEAVEGYIHVEVRKLYENAELPTFETSRPDSHTLEMIYRSSRHFEDLAEGLISGCLNHFDLECSIHREPLNAAGDTLFRIVESHG